MFDIDLGSYSLEQLVERQDKLYQRLTTANNFGSGQMIDSLQRLITQVDMEVSHRLAVDNAMALMAASPTIVETDPDLARLHKKEVADLEEEDVQPDTPRRTRLRRSTVRITPEDLDKDN